MVLESDLRHIAALERYIACKKGEFADDEDACRGCILDPEVKWTPEEAPDSPAQITLRIAPCWFLSELLAEVVKEEVRLLKADLKPRTDML